MLDREIRRRDGARPCAVGGERAVTQPYRGARVCQRTPGAGCLAIASSSRQAPKRSCSADFRSPASAVTRRRRWPCSTPLTQRRSRAVKVLC